MKNNMRCIVLQEINKQNTKSIVQHSLQRMDITLDEQTMK